jgi:hypothetical protein
LITLSDSNIKHSGSLGAAYVLPIQAYVRTVQSSPSLEAQGEESKSQTSSTTHNIELYSVVLVERKNKTCLTLLFKQWCEKSSPSASHFKTPLQPLDLDEVGWMVFEGFFYMQSSSSHMQRPNLTVYLIQFDASLLYIFHQ